MTVLPAAQEKSTQGLVGCYSMDSPHTREMGGPTPAISKDHVSSSVKIPLAVLALFFSIPLLIWFSCHVWYYDYLDIRRVTAPVNTYFTNFFTQKGRLLFSLNLSCLFYQFPFQYELFRDSFKPVFPGIGVFFRDLMWQCKRSKWNIHTKLQQCLLFCISCKVY